MGLKAKKRVRKSKNPRSQQRKKSKLMQSRVTPPQIVERWQPGKSGIMNMTAMGLKVDPNMEDFQVPNPIEVKVAEPKPRERRVLTELTFPYMKALVEKHGDDIRAMRRDIKLNTDQLTETKLEKMLETYHYMLENDIEPRLL